nr:MAG TPA: hypothetical protein [Caudoviricetes sp.]
MKHLFRLRNESYSFDKKGMILRGETPTNGQGVFVKAWDMYLDNKNIMSDDDIESCFVEGTNYKWVYFMDDLETLNHKISLSKLEYELLKYCINHSYQYIARDNNKALFAYDTKPYKIQYEWKATKEIKRINFRDLFSFVKWEDDEPYSITYILNNCEIVEDK